MVEGDAESALRRPGNLAANIPHIAQIDMHHVTAFHVYRRFGHQAAGG